MKNKLIALVTVSLFAVNAFAGAWLDHERSLPKELKNHNRLYIGYTVSQIGLRSGKDHETVKTPVNGVTIGYARCSNLTTHNTAAKSEFPLFLEWGVNATWQYLSDFRKFLDPSGDYKKVDGYSYHFNYMNVAVPINFSYVFHLGDFSIKPYLGPNLKFNVLAQAKVKTPDNEETVNVLTGKGTVKTNEESVDIDLSDKVAKFKKFQAGYNVGVTFGYKFFNIGYQFQGEFMPLCENSNGIKTWQNNHSVVLGFDF